MCAWVKHIALRLAPASDVFYSGLLSEFDRRISFLLALTFYPSVGPCQGRANYRASILKHRSAVRTAAIGMQERNSHAFYRSLSENNGHAR
jgi:hypothetical protein